MGSRNSRGIKTGGKRSGLEANVGVVERYGFKHESEKIPYLVPQKKKKYLPDYKKGPLVIEAKGRFTTADRQKMLLVQEQHPELVILMVFGRAHNTIAKKSRTTYGDWCTKNNLSWVNIDLFEKEHKTICQLLTMKKKIFGTLPILPQRKKKAS